MEVAQVTDTEDDIREFARITPVDAAPEMATFPEMATP